MYREFSRNRNHPSSNPLLKHDLSLQGSEIRCPPASGLDTFNHLVLRIETDEGVSGFSTGDYAELVAYKLIKTVLAPVLIGEEALRTDWLWEKMFRVGGPGARRKQRHQYGRYGPVGPQTKGRY